MDEFEALYRRHAAAIFRFACGLCGDRTRAEDILSETFERVLTRAPRIETRTALAYLLAVARNAYITGLRRRRREVPLPEDLQAPDRDPEGRLDEKARLDKALQALHGLPEGERAALLLRAEHDLSYEEIAAILGTSIVAARVRVHRARHRLSSLRGGIGGFHEDRSDA